MQFLDLTMDKVYQCIHLLVKRIFKNLAVDDSQDRKLIRVDGVNLRGDLKLGIEDIRLCFLHTRRKTWNVQQEIGDICPWCSKAAFKSLKSSNHHLLSDICRGIWEQSGSDVLEIAFNILLDTDVDKC